MFNLYLNCFNLSIDLVFDRERKAEHVDLIALFIA